MKALSHDNLENYIALQRELTLMDPYVLPINRQALEEQLTLSSSIPNIALLQYNSEYIGFVEIEQTTDVLFIESIFLSPSLVNLNSPSALEGFEKMLSFAINSTSESAPRQIKFIGPMNRDPLHEAFVKTGFKLAKEHIQMEMPLGDIHQSEQPLAVSPLRHFEDAPALHDFMTSCMSGATFNYTIEEVADILEQDNPLALQLSVNSKPVGFVIAYINALRNQQQGQQVVYIEQLAISPAYRQKGFAENLLQYIFCKAQSQAIDTARLHVYSENPSAFNLYKKLGFVEVKSIGHWIFSK